MKRCLPIPIVTLLYNPGQTNVELNDESFFQFSASVGQTVVYKNLSTFKFDESA